MNTERTQIKRATKLLVDSVHGIEAAASILGKGHSTVGRWVNRNESDCWINIADLAELEANAPAPLVTIALARLTGHKLVPLAGSSGSADVLPMQIMELLQEAGQLCHSIRTGFEDGDFSRSDASRALDELHDVEGCVAKLHQALNNIAADHPGLRSVA